MVQPFHIPMELIPTFLLLAEELNISRGAKRLGISQPALTRQLQTLEESFGLQLFVRQSRGLALTQTGRALKKEILPVYEKLVGAIDKIHNLRAELGGRISFGCFSEVGTNLISPSLSRFAKSNPGISFDIQYLSELEIISGVTNGQLQLGLTSHAPHQEALRSYKLLDERIHIITSPKNPDIEKNRHPRFAGYRTNDRLLSSFLKTHTELLGKESPEIAFAINSHPAIIQAVVELDLYAVLPDHSIKSALLDGTVRLASKKELLNRVHLILPDSEFPDRRTLEVVKFLRQRFKDIEGDTK